MLTKDEALELVKRLNLKSRSQEEEDYLANMLEGECDICVLAKFGAVHDALTLTNGAKTGRRRLENALIGSKDLHVDHEKELLNPYRVRLDNEQGRVERPESTTIRETLTTFPSDGVNSLYTMNPFSSLSEVLELTSIIESGIQTLEHNTDQPSIYRRQRAIENLREFTRSFNILVHSSEIADAEDEVRYFFPRLYDFSTAILQLKPLALQHRDETFELLQQLGLRTIKREHVVERNVELVHVVKAGCAVDLTALATMKAMLTFPLMPHHFPELFSVFLSDSNFETYLRQLHPSAFSFSGEYVLRASTRVQREVASFCFLSTTGEDITSSPLQVWEADDSHAVIRGKAESGEVREVRIRHRVISTDNAAERKSLQSEYECIAWFYKEVRELWPKLIPPYFNYRIEPTDSAFNLERVFTVEESMGDYFLPAVAKDMKLHRGRELPKFMNLTQKNRGSAVAFMWGRKLAKLCLKIEQCKSEEIEDCGVLYYNGTEILGSMDDLNFLNLEKERFFRCLDDLKAVWLSYIPVDTAVDIESKVLKCLESEAFTQTRQMSEIAMVPESLKYSNLRIFKYNKKASEFTPDELAELKRFHMDEDMLLMLELEGRSDSELKVQDFAMMDVAPAKFSKRHMAGNVIWLLDVYLKKLERHLHVTEGDPDEYEALLESVRDGFKKNYPVNDGLQDIAFFKMELLFFSLWEAWKVLLAMHDLQDRKATIIEERDRMVRAGRGAFKQIVDDAGLLLRGIDEERERWEYELTLQLEYMGTITLEPELSDEERQRRMKVGHERYFKFFGLDDFDPDIKNKRYPDRITAQKFPSLAAQAVRNITMNPSSLEMRWLNPQPYDGTNIREVPEDAYRLDSTAVKKSRWFTQEKQKQLVQQAIGSLMAASRTSFARA